MRHCYSPLLVLSSPVRTYAATKVFHEKRRNSKKKTSGGLRRRLGDRHSLDVSDAKSSDPLHFITEPTPVHHYARHRPRKVMIAEESTSLVQPQND